MEIKNKPSQILTTNDNFSRLESIKDGYFDYNFIVSVNKLSVISSKAKQITIRTYKNNPKNSVNLSLFNINSNQTLNVLNQNSNTLISRIIQRPISVITEIASARNSCYTTNSFDIGGLITKYNHGIGYTTVSEQKENVSGEVYTSSEYGLKNELNEDQIISSLNYKLLKEEKIDPASIITKIYSTETSYDSFNGCNKNEYLQSKLINYSDNSKNIINHLLSSSPQDTIDDITIQTYNIESSDTVNVAINQLFPVDILGNSDFYLMITVIDVEKNIVQEIVKHIEHRKNIALLNKIKQAPIFNVKNYNNGTIGVFLQQTDTNAVGVKIYKTEFNTSEGTTSTEQTFIGSYELNYGNTLEKTYNIDSPDLTILRALSYNSSGETSSEFSSQVVYNPISENKNFIAIKTEYTVGGLNVKFSNIPPSISILKLYKRILNKNSEDLFLETFYLGGKTDFTSLSYFDTDLSEFDTYQYLCKATDDKGQEFYCTGLDEVYYRPVKTNYAVITVSPPFVENVQLPTTSDQLFDTNFTISYTISKKLEDHLRDILTQQNLIEFFGSDINRNNLKNLLVTKVELVNNDSNERSFLDYTSDVFQQSKTKYGYLKADSNYSYELTTYVRNPSTIIPSVVLTGSSTVRSNESKQYTFIPSVINHPFALQMGTNPKQSGDEFVNFYGLNQLSFGDVISIDYLNIDLKGPKASVNEVKAFMFNSQNVELTWSVNGNQTDISHFIIKRQNINTGKIDLIGKAHGINPLNTFSYIDPIRHTEVGVFRYILIIQYFNMSLSKEYISNEVIIT